MNQINMLDRSSGAAGSYKVDAARGERIGRVSSEWFSRPADERFGSVRARGGNLLTAAV